MGTYLALACANRIVDPCSKRGFADWWATTAGPRWVKLDRAALDHRRFWDAMDRLGEVQLREIQTRLGRAMVTEFGLDLTGLALVITRDGGVPVIAHAYPGDRPDVTQFTMVIDELVARYRDLVAGIEALTVVYDGGQNSGDNPALPTWWGSGVTDSDRVGD